MTTQSEQTLEQNLIEKQIDQLVYKLYNLTSEEIKIINRGVN